MTYHAIFTSPSVRAILMPVLMLVAAIAHQPVSRAAAPVVASLATSALAAAPSVESAASKSKRTFYMTEDGRVTKEKPERFVRTVRAGNAAEARRNFGC